MEKYSWDFNKDAEIWRSDTCNTIEECIVAAQEENKLDGNLHEVVFIGKNVEYVPYVDVGLILENLQEQAANEMGELGVDWDAYDHKKAEELDELQESVQEVVMAWLKKFSYYPNMWNITEVIPYSIAEATS